MTHPATTQHPRAPRVIGFGDNVVDRFIDRGLLYPGGNSVNFAVFARQLGADASYLGVLADDEAGVHIQWALARLGVPTHRSQIRHGATGWCDVRVIDGDRVFGDWSAGVTAEHEFELGDRDLDYLGGFDLIHSGAYANAERLLPRLRTTDALLVFDLSDEPEQRADDYLDRVAPHADLAVTSVADLDWDDAEAHARDIVARGAGMSLVTRGLAGSGLYDGSEFHRADAVRVDALDTMGCGDAFITSLTLALLGAGWTRHHRPTAAEIRHSLHTAAEFAAAQCAVEAAFGYAKEYLQ